MLSPGTGALGPKVPWSRTGRWNKEPPPLGAKLEPLARQEGPGGRVGHRRERPASHRAGPRAPEIALGPGGGRGSLSPRVAVGSGTRTRRTWTRPRAPAGEGGGRGSARPCARRARLRPLAVGAGGARPPLGLLPLTTAPARPGPPGSPAPPTPRRTCAAERERNRLCSTAQRKAKTPHATASAHTRAPSPVYISALNLTCCGQVGQAGDQSRLRPLSSSSSNWVLTQDEGVALDWL
nr:collagen alpha-1(I) chain-like [Equus caballus]